MNRQTFASAVVIGFIALLPSACATPPRAGAGAPYPPPPATFAEDHTVRVPEAVIADKIRGGLLAQIFGNLNGLPHEMKYIHEPGQVMGYVPSLPEGAFSDDDTALEWVHTFHMHGDKQILLPYDRLTTLWPAQMSKYVLSANRIALELLALGVKPPYTGRAPVNPLSGYNIAGQFTTETYALVAPGMPRTAARTGLHYAHMAVEGEPTQATQLFTAMVAAAFFESDLERIVAAGLAATDPHSTVHLIALDVWRSFRQHPHDWQATRAEILQRYQRHEGEGRDMNGYETNTASVVGAFLHGGGDVAKSLELAFNFGWDADCNAATVGAIVGVMRGHAWMAAQNWVFADRYRNNGDNGLPAEETVSAFAERLVALARMNVEENGGRVLPGDDGAVWEIVVQRPEPQETLTALPARKAELEAALLPEVERDLQRDDGAPRDLARAVYLAIALDKSEAMKERHPVAWARGLEALGAEEALLGALFRTPRSSEVATLLRERLLKAGVVAP